MKALELRAAAGHFASVERRLFEIAGGWVPTVGEPEVKVLLRVQSFAHAWHADLWDEVEPRSGPAIDDAIGQAGAEAGGEAGAALRPVLDAVEDATRTVERLGGLYRVVLPRLADAYRALSDEAVPASDGPLVRALSLMLSDEIPAIDEAERLIGGLPGDPIPHQQRIAALLADVWGAGMPELR